MKILHIPTGAICGYAIYPDDSVISVLGTERYIPFRNITENEYNILWSKKYISIQGLREDGGTIFYGDHNNKASVNNGLYVVPEEFELI